MLVLLKFDENRRLEDATPDEQAETAFDFVRNAYFAQRSNNDVYCYKPPCDYATALQFVDGAVNPQSIKNLAINWNQSLQQDFDNALTKLMAKTPTDRKNQRQYLQAPSVEIYEMRKAATALDNFFDDCANKALLVSPLEYFTTVLTAPERTDIVMHPENYAAMQIAIKS